MEALFSNRDNKASTINHPTSFNGASLNGMETH